MRALLFVALLALALALPGARAELAVQGGHEASLALRAAPTGYEAAASFPFTVPGNGLVYAKLLTVPGNVVNDGAYANGTLGPDGRGESGWWTTLSFLTSAGTLAAGSAPVARVDGAPTDAVKVADGATVTLQALVHAPADAFLYAMDYQVHLVLAFRPAQDSTRGSGGVMDEGVALTLNVRQSTDALAADYAPNTSGDSTESAPAAAEGKKGGSGSILSPLIVGASLGAVAIVGGAVVLSAFRGKPRHAPRLR